MGFCQGMVTDDIVAHEFTHGVTKYESALAYSGESGAINESFSDIWGELVDLTYGSDSPSDDWLIGEGSSIGVIRDMDEPHTYGDPEIYLEANYWYSGGDSSTFVHTNSGVGNKVCHLLVAGDSNFRGSSFSPLSTTRNVSIAATVKLFYEVQVNRLLSSADYLDLGDELESAVVDAALGTIDIGDDISWNATAVQKVVNALAATGIDD